MAIKQAKNVVRGDKLDLRTMRRAAPCRGRPDSVLSAARVEFVRWEGSTVTIDVELVGALTLAPHYIVTLANA
jgi:hypothetical protein